MSTRIERTEPSGGVVDPNKSTLPQDFTHFVRLLAEMGVPMAHVELVPFKNYARKDGARTQAIEHVISPPVRGSNRHA